MKVQYSYLKEQFSNPMEVYFEDLRPLIASGEFTFGPFVEAFEKKFASYIGAKHVIGTSNGTDALILSLKSLGLKAGDEVITVPNTFYATVGSIVAIGACPVFVDCNERYQIDAEKIEAAISSKTKAILPVHWAGCSPDIEAVLDIAQKYGLDVVEDACPATGATINGKFAGTFGKVNAFSMHPLKPLNVMGDGGLIATNDDSVAEFIRIYQNHGMVDRDHNSMWGINSRLQPIQAVIASRVLDEIEDSIRARNRNASRLDEGLKQLEGRIQVPLRPQTNREVYQLYQIGAKRREELLPYLISKGIEAKIHYPVPLHLQKAAEELGYKTGDFPVCERQAGEIVTLPAHQYITEEQVDYMVSVMCEFYS
ncbi:MAG: transcriptional regulator [Deltaproteobacteria bacterium CG11_big_fil_rev_8_21_14_0_20_42_23]|nr:MAG: transcriptional regulator [Deltaproteobacteria bacterium CG11_big_fil_rev_8_21_14_0_20_42_23]PJC64561.1 MAG: transcriptional regulator [Deltaproteobacteria bacterium CG_4_9_14_0_2_um_filter_42_21]